ncbi:hypothetical protein [Asanoa siamensis]|uniref:WD40 repeat protein n=1 Tax=Asanoa siamensis TaxID=926357 RepID=A0ABQ4CKQ5_9ACTN|nr:hypothetical protein [Asanoa siamensis]GIF71882.1 hypothetical protein Asi02nite_14000 [Asanoa siamensis]
MTARLRESLHDAATDVPAYPVYERSLATARRSRRRSALATALVLVALAGAGVAVPLVARPATEPAVGADAGAALPDRVGVPPRGNLHSTDWPPLGPASVVFAGQAPGLMWGDEGSIITIVGATDDRYRIIKGRNEAQPGEDTVLSPDGRRIAVGTGSSARVVDLMTGRSRAVDTGVSDVVSSEAAAWSPDGRAVVVRETVPANAEGSAYRMVLSLVRLDGSGRVRLAEADHAAGLGSPVAFAPDRLAYQTGRTVTVAGLDGRQQSAFALAPDTELAGKGAWNADGTLTIARRDGSGWSLRRVDAHTGRDLGALDTPAVADVTAIRLLGWSADGSARVVAYVPSPTAPAAFDVPLTMDQRLAYGNVGTVEVLALDRGATAPTTLLTAPADVVAIDVADTVIRSGRTRAATPPEGIGPRFWFWTILLVLLGVGIVAYRRRVQLALWLDDRRVRRSRRQRPPR